MIHYNVSVRSLIYSHIQNDKHFKHGASCDATFNKLEERAMKLGNGSIQCERERVQNMVI